MTETWKQWQGQVVNGELYLRQYLGGSDHSAVFLTECGGRERQKAAIKLIPADPANAELQLSRWTLAAKLSHPHLIRLFQVGSCQLDNVRLLYVVMEYAEEDLSQILPHRPLTPAEARDMLGPVLDVLAYLHAQGFVHGRIGPTNIMAIGEQIKISADGLYQIGESRASQGKPGAYDPPEIAAGRISPAGDVWSLGLTLVEALTQRLPVSEGTEEGEPVLPGAIPPPFLDIARHCLRRDPQRRWTVADIVARLRQPSPLPERRATAPPQQRPAKRRYIVPVVAVGLALAAILTGLRLLNRRPEAPRVSPIASESPRVQPIPERKTPLPEIEQSSQTSSNGNQAASGPAPSPTSLPPGAAANTAAGSVVPGEVLQRVLPDVPQQARNTIRGTVRVSVRVRVAPSGDVAAATFDSPGPSKYFANLALQAAQRWEFAPAKLNGRAVSSEWILRFEFGRAATNVIPIEAAP